MRSRTLGRGAWSLSVVLILALATWLSPQSMGGVGRALAAGQYQNPLSLQTPNPIGGNSLVQTCAWPSIIHSQTAGNTNWYMYCASDILNSNDKTFHLIPMFRSADLITWSYVGDAFSARPPWVKPDAALLGPDIHYFNNQYYLYYWATDTKAGGSAIGVATSQTPVGPWTDAGAPVVEPHEAYCCPGSRRPVADPTVVNDNGQMYIAFGAEFGGISIRKLSSDGLHSDPTSARLIAIDNKWESPFLWKHGDYWYLFLSQDGCCSGNLSGYGTFVGRSKDIEGPYLDETGHDLMSGNNGGTPVLQNNGNRWVGPGGGSVFTDAGGQDWMVYEAVDRNDPFFAGTTNTKRPALLDPVTWQNDWPQVRGGFWASDTPIGAPAAQAGDKTSYQTTYESADKLGKEIKKYSDTFKGKKLSKKWSWVRKPPAGKFGVGGGVFHMVSEDADLYQGTNTASVLLEKAPSGNYAVDAKVWVALPSEGCCYNYIQSGLVIYKDDDNYVKLVHNSVWNTRQTEWAKEANAVYGSMAVGPPSDWTWLRIVKRTQGTEDAYRAYTSTDGKHWTRGGVWTQPVWGSSARIGIVAMGGLSFAKVKYVKVHAIK